MLIMQKSAELKNRFLVENGDVILLENNNSRIIEKVYSGRILLKGNKTFSLDNSFLKNLKVVSSGR